jgi:hypothetical protein
MERAPPISAAGPQWLRGNRHREELKSVERGPSFDGLARPGDPESDRSRPSFLDRFARARDDVRGLTDRRVPSASLKKRDEKRRQRGERLFMTGSPLTPPRQACRAQQAAPLPQTGTPGHDPW